MNFSLERFQDVWPELQPLVRQHYEEIAHYLDIPLDVDVEAYSQAEDQGILRCFTVREEKELVGYCAFFVRQAPHYKGSKQASQDVLFLSPNWRGLKVGAMFIKWCDDRLREEGVQVVCHHVKQKPALNFGPLLEKMDYELVDLIYCKRLDYGN